MQSPLSSMQKLTTMQHRAHGWDSEPRGNYRQDTPLVTSSSASSHKQEAKRDRINPKISHSNSTAPPSLEELRNIIQNAHSNIKTPSMVTSPKLQLSPTVSKGSEMTGIAKACLAVENWLLQNADDHRAFFDSVFRLFLQHCFGLGKPKDTSWLYIVSKNPKSKEAIQLRQLLEPSGVLMKAITEADERGLYPSGFTFPIETLPPVAGIARTQFLLRRGQGTLIAELPHYAGRLITNNVGTHKTEVRLSLWEYFISWFVFYAVQGPTQVSLQNKKFPNSNSDFPHMAWNQAASVAKGLFSGPSQKGDTSYSSYVYRDLLCSYIKYYIKFQVSGADLQGSQTIRAMATGKQNNTLGKSKQALKRNFMLDIMLEFWLSDLNQVDASSMRTVSFVTPSQDLIASIKALIKHLVHSAIKDTTKNLASTPALSPRMTVSTHRTHADEDLRQETMLIMRNIKMALFRFLLRCFALWSNEASSSLKPIISLWLSYIAPWSDELPKKEISSWESKSLIMRKLSPSITRSTPAFEERSDASGTWADWKEHIHANMPFYTILLQYFIGIEHKRAALRPESSLTDIALLFDVLSKNQKLISFLRETELDLQMHASGSMTGSKHFDRLSIARNEYHELQKHALNGLPPNAALEELPFSIYNPKENSLSISLQESIDMIRLAKSIPSSKVESLAKKSSEIFGIDFKVAKSPSKLAKNTQAELALYRSFTWHDVVAFKKRYKGDWMKRPISSFEIGFLVHFYISLSESLNKTLGLGGYEGDTFVHSEDGNVVQQAIYFGRKLLNKYKIRVDLRFLAGIWPTTVIMVYSLSALLLDLSALILIASPILICILITMWFAEYRSHIVHTKRR